MKVTELEMTVLEALKTTDFSSDGVGIKGYLDQDDFSISMNRVKGAMSSLVQKGILYHETLQTGFNEVSEWYEVEDDYQKEDNSSTIGYIYKNIELIK